MTWSRSLVTVIQCLDVLTQSNQAGTVDSRTIKSTFFLHKCGKNTVGHSSDVQHVKGISKEVSVFVRIWEVPQRPRRRCHGNKELIIQKSRTNLDVTQVKSRGKMNYRLWYGNWTWSSSCGLKLIKNSEVDVSTLTTLTMKTSAPKVLQIGADDFKLSFCH